MMVFSQKNILLIMCAVLGLNASVHAAADEMTAEDVQKAMAARSAAPVVATTTPAAQPVATKPAVTAAAVAQSAPDADLELPALDINFTQTSSSSKTALANLPPADQTSTATRTHSSSVPPVRIRHFMRSPLFTQNQTIDFVAALSDIEHQLKYLGKSLQLKDQIKALDETISSTQAEIAEVVGKFENIVTTIGSMQPASHN